MSVREVLYAGVGLALVALWGVDARADDAAPKHEGKMWVVDSSVAVDAPAAVVFRYTGDLRRWQDWTSWNKQKDPACVWEYSGEAGKVDHAMRWNGPELGQGNLVLTKVEDDSIWFDLYFGKSKQANQGYITVTEGVSPHTVTWHTEGRLGFPGRLFKKKIEASVTQDFQAGLARLKPLVEVEARMDAWKAQVAAMEQQVSSLHAEAVAARKSADAQLAEAQEAVKAASDAASSKKAADRKAASGLAALAEAKKGMASRADQEAVAKEDRYTAAKVLLDALKASPPQS